MQNNKQIFAIVSDIDGVLIRGKKRIEKSNIVVNDLLESYYCTQSNPKFKIPFYLLTNGGGCTEQNKATSLNQILNVNISKHHVILNFTPLRQIMQKYSQKFVLLSGAGDLRSIAKDCGLHKFFTIDEYAALYDQVHFNTYNDKIIQKYIKDIQERDNEFDVATYQNIEIEAVFILFDPIKWEESIQSIINLIKLKNELPIYVVNDDIMYADQFRLPRIAFGTFTNALIKIVQKQFQINPNIIYYGKPSLNTYKYVEQYIHRHHQNVGNIYMIGDNPPSDIRGANQIGWISILVKSGVFHGENNDENDPGQFVVNDIYEAYNLILSLEGASKIKD